MTVESDTSVATASVSAEAIPPATVADDQKTAAPASGADVENSEPAAETPEQLEAKKESRRARQNARRTQAIADARAEAKLLREENERLRTQQQAPKQSDEPKREAFDDLESYYRAVARWEAKQVTSEASKESEKALQGREQTQRQAEKNAEVAQSWDKREKEFIKAKPDYMKVVEPFVEDELQDLHQQARAAIVESGPELLYHLATHSEEVERLAALSPTRQIAELGKLETKLGNTAKPSGAPEPITPLGQGRSGTKDPSKMTDAEYKTFRKAQGARWAQ